MAGNISYPYAANDDPGALAIPKIGTLTSGGMVDLSGSAWAQFTLLRAAARSAPDAAPVTKADIKRTPRRAKEKPMSDFVSRDELKAHLGLIEEKAQRRADAVEAKIDRLADTVDRLVVTVGEVRTQTRDDNKATRNTVVVTAIGSTLAVISIVATIVWGAVQIVNATQGTMTAALGNSIAAYTAGKDDKSVILAPSPARTEKGK